MLHRAIILIIHYTQRNRCYTSGIVLSDKDTANYLNKSNHENRNKQPNTSIIILFLIILLFLSYRLVLLFDFSKD